MADHFVNVRLENDTAAKALITADREPVDGDERPRHDLWVLPDDTNPQGRILQNVPVADSDEGTKDSKGKPLDEVHYAWPLDGTAPDQTDQVDYPGLDDAPERPAGNASADEWRAYAVGTKRLTEEQAGGKSRDDIRALFA